MSSFSPTQSVDSFADAYTSVTLLVKGRLQEGGLYWAYIAMKPSMISEFKDANKRGMFDLEEYGAILEFGEGGHPPADLVERMYRTYGMPVEKERELLGLFDA